MPREKPCDKPGLKWILRRDDIGLRQFSRDTQCVEYIEGSRNRVGRKNAQTLKFVVRCTVAPTREPDDVELAKSLRVCLLPFRSRSPEKKYPPARPICPYLQDPHTI